MRSLSTAPRLRKLGLAAQRLPDDGDPPLPRCDVRAGHGHDRRAEAKLAGAAQPLDVIREAALLQLAPCDLVAA